MPILNFSNQTFKVEKIANVKVEDLVKLAHQNQPRLFVVHDPVQKTTAVVIPELVVKVIISFSFLRSNERRTLD